MKELPLITIEINLYLLQKSNQLITQYEGSR